GCGVVLGGDVLAAVGSEARPVVGVGDDDGRLEVSESHDVVAGVGIGGDVDGAVGDAGGVEGAGGSGALGAMGLGVDGDGHVVVLPGGPSASRRWVVGDGSVSR